MSPRILILSWEYPPIVAGGLARHVRKLSEELVAQGVEVHVLTRGGRAHPTEEQRAGVRVHRVAEPDMPSDLDAFVAWVEAMNAHLPAAGRRLGKRMRFDVVHGHDRLVAGAAAGLAERLRCAHLTTIHATEYGRHQGWVGGYHSPTSTESRRGCPGEPSGSSSARTTCAATSPTSRTSPSGA